MFTPKVYKIGAIVTNQAPFETDDGVFSAGHLFEVIRVDDMGIQAVYDVRDIDGNIARRMKHSELDPTTHKKLPLPK